ncbi:MAG: ShlB/FhaC/HecB family hemolysin secretion/activation protein [Gammaproteobacteria bacterium]
MARGTPVAPTPRRRAAALRALAAPVCALWLLTAAAADLGFAVDAFTVEGDNPLSAADTAAVLDGFLGPERTLDDLDAAAAALTRALHAAGHVLVLAVVPPQTVAGTVRLELVRFTIGDLRIEEGHYFDAANVRRALPTLVPGASPRLAEIARDQLFANEHPSRQLTTVLLEGTAPDTVDIGVRVNERRPWGVFATVDDSGTDDSGQLRTGFGVQHANLFGRDHALTATYTGAPGHWGQIEQYGLYYRAPIYALHGAVSVYYTYSDSDFGTVARFFEVRGQGEFLGLRWSQQLAPIGAYRHTAEVGIEDRSFQNDLSFAGLPLGQDLRARPVLARYAGSYAGAGFVADHAVELAVNTGTGGHDTARAYRANRAGAHPAWQALRFALGWTRPWADWTLAARLRGQFSEDALTAGEQIGLGGAAGLRGLNERNATGDSGLVAVGEALTPPLAGSLRALAFVDSGVLWQNDAGGVEGGDAHATSLGLGLRWQWRDHAALAADWAYVVSGDEGQQGANRGHVALLLRY